METHKPNRKPSVGLDVWSTTFADILTLVLSFFIATISISPLNPASEAAKKRQIPSVSQESGAGADRTAVAVSAGTPLATMTRRDPQRNPVEVIELLDSDFAAGFREVAPLARERLKTAVIPDGYQRTSVRIESCDRAGNEELGFERGMALRRQVFDAGGGRPTIRLAVSDGDCRGLADLSPTATARVTIRRFE